MKLAEFLEHVIDDGIEAARLDYIKRGRELHRDGAIAGFTECRGKSPQEIGILLTEARKRSEQAVLEQAPDYWYWRCRELEVGWVANVISAALLNQGLPTIVQPTARGVMKAADILGIATTENGRRFSAAG